MKRISYAGGSILTGDAVADAVLDYAIALARVGFADHIVVPGIGADDAPTSIDLVVGPASQLFAEPEDTRGEEFRDDAFVAELAHRSRLAAAGRPELIGRDPEELT